MKRSSAPSRPRQLGLLLFLLLLAPALSGFTGNVGQEAEFYVGVGIGQIDTQYDSDRYGEIGGVFRFKFRNFPYDDLAGWLQVGASWTTYPTGGNYGNQILSIQYMGGVKKNFGEFGGGFILSGDTTGTGPLLVFPCFRMLLGKEDKAMFGFGVLDEVPLYAISNAMHMEGIFAIPVKGPVRPWVKVGTRLNLYVPRERFPLEFITGIEIRIKRQLKIMVDGSIGDGGSVSMGGTEPADGLSPSFSLALRIGGAVGPGVTSDRRPVPAD
jgi:hypothetical protein